MRFFDDLPFVGLALLTIVASVALLFGILPTEPWNVGGVIFLWVALVVLLSRRARGEEDAIKEVLPSEPASDDALHTDPDPPPPSPAP